MLTAGTGIRDDTETNLLNLRRTIYLTIQSSANFEEAGHKLLKIQLKEGQEIELARMICECCSQEKTYLRFYGLLATRFCMIDQKYIELFEDCFIEYVRAFLLNTSIRPSIASKPTNCAISPSYSLTC